MTVQARRYYARERRKALDGGPPALHRTREYPIPSTPILAAEFPDTDVPITLRTRVRIVANAGVHEGLIFEVGDAATAMAAWIDDDQIAFRAGDALAADRGLASVTTGTGELQIDREFDLTFVVNPGDGRVRIWDRGDNELARDAASNGQLPNGWAASSNGAFAAAAVGALPADVLQTGAPNGFVVIRPLSVFVGQVPRHFH